MISIPEDLLECGICQEVLRDPKQLYCGHTFCDECIKRAVQASNVDGSIDCPYCRNRTIIPINGLNTNFVIKEVISKMKTLEVQLWSDSKKIESFTCECNKIIKYSEALICKSCSFSDKDIPNTSQAYLPDFNIICGVCLLKKHKKHDVYLLGDLFNVEERREMVNKLSEMVQKQYLKLKELVEINYKNVNTLSNEFIKCERLLEKLMKNTETPFREDAKKCEEDILNLNFYNKNDEIQKLFEKFNADLSDLLSKEEPIERPKSLISTDDCSLPMVSSQSEVLPQLNSLREVSFTRFNR